jgi:phosphatidylglycerophosphate synthase
MLDGSARKLFGPALTRMGFRLAAIGISANAISWAGFLTSLAAAAAIAANYFLAGLVLILAGRLCDGLDGAVARVNGKTDLGGYFDIVLDFGAYGIIPLGFAFADPATNAIPAAVLLVSFYFNGASFLAFAIMAEKRKMASTVRGEKSLFFTTGLAEATETIAVFCAMCLFPGWFGSLAWAFAAVVFYTTASRIVLAARTFRT